MKKNIYKIRLAIAGFIGIFSVCAFLGFYPIKFFNLQFIPLFEQLTKNFSLSVLIIFLLLITLTAIFGRFYCSTICPLGIFQEFAGILLNKKTSKTKNKPFKYIISGICLGSLIGGSTLIIKFLDPYTIFGSLISMSLFGIVISICILALTLYKNRFFCTNICPIGAILGLLSKFSPNKIYVNIEECASCGICEKICPSGSIDSETKTIDNITCVRCLNCLSKCKKGAIKFGMKKEEIKFNHKRRDFIFTAAVLTLFGGAIKAGAEIAKSSARKLKNIILPAGAENESRMINKCLNCNLCVTNCPNKILAKADNNFKAVHIDFSKGEGYCKYECNQCSKVCPIGAIKKISLKEKQKTKIATASINRKTCHNCSVCIYMCPKGAISKVNGEVIINEAKCIGCGKCKKICPHKAIEIFSVRNQSII